MCLYAIWRSVRRARLRGFGLPAWHDRYQVAKTALLAERAAAVADAENAAFMGELANEMFGGVRTAAEADERRAVILAEAVQLPRERKPLTAEQRRLKSEREHARRVAIRSVKP